MRRADSFDAASVLRRYAESQGARLRIGDAKRLVADRFRELGDLVVVPPTRYPSPIKVIANIDRLTATPLAIEALWDADLDYFIIDLAAIVERASEQHHRFDAIVVSTFIITKRGMLEGDDEFPWTAGRLASEVGQAVADHFSVPFHFPSPREFRWPRESARWWDDMA